MDVSKNSAPEILRPEWPSKTGEVRKGFMNYVEAKIWRKDIGLRPKERRVFPTGVISLTKLTEAVGFGEQQANHFWLWQTASCREIAKLGQNVFGVQSDFLNNFFIFFLQSRF